MQAVKQDTRIEFEPFRKLLNYGEYKEASTMLRNIVNKELRESTTTKVYIDVVCFLVEVKDYKKQEPFLTRRWNAARHLYKYCKQILNEL